MSDHHPFLLATIAFMSKMPESNPLQPSPLQPLASNALSDTTQTE